MEKKAPIKKDHTKTKQEKRQQNLQQALRDNLKRRKRPTKTKDTTPDK